MTRIFFLRETFTVDIALLAMTVLCKPEDRLRVCFVLIFFPSIIHFCCISSEYKTSGLEKMHRCILIAIISLRFYIHHFPGTVLLLGIPDLKKRKIK